MNENESKNIEEKAIPKFKPFNDINVGLLITWSVIFVFILALRIFHFGNAFFSIILLLSVSLFPLILMIIELLNYHRYEENTIQKDYTLAMPVVFQNANLIVVALGLMSAIASYKRWQLIIVSGVSFLIAAVITGVLYGKKKYSFKWQWICYLISFVLVIGLFILTIYINYEWSIVY